MHKAASARCEVRVDCVERTHHSLAVFLAKLEHLVTRLDDTREASLNVLRSHERVKCVNVRACVCLCVHVCLCACVRDHEMDGNLSADVAVCVCRKVAILRGLEAAVRRLAVIT